MTMSAPHFVQSYERLVDELLKQHPLDEAMARAVGGGYEHGGAIEADIMEQLGLAAGAQLIDLGCGSGRLSTALGYRFGNLIDYLGIDIVQSLLDYAAAKAPPAYRFVLHRDLSIPAPSASADFVVAFSVFTHLRTPETLAYLADAKRVLRPGGAVVFSFLTLPQHWRMLIGDIKGRLRGTLPHLVTYTQPWTIRRWARQLGFRVEQFDAPESIGHRMRCLGAIAPAEYN